MARKSSDPLNKQPESCLSANMRTTVTLLLIFHLFALAIGVLSHTRPLSPLRNQLSDVPIIRPYLQLLHMDTAYNFHLTDGLEEDLDHHLLIERQAATASQTDGAEPVLRLPEQGLQPGIRRERFQQLAQRTAVGGDGDPVRPLLAKTIGGALLRRAGAPDGAYRFRIQRQMVVDRENSDSPQLALSDPDDASRFATAYEGAIILSETDAFFSEIAPEAQRAGLREDSAADTPRP